MKLAGLLLAAFVGSAPAEVHYAPTENLEQIDVRLLDDAEHTIDLAAYVLTDYAVIAALRDAADRGVVVRILRTRPETEGGEDRYPPSEAYRALAATPGIEIRTKRAHDLMHLKSYCRDGDVLRTGSANFSPSGLKRQDNDLILLRGPAPCAAFEADFARAWSEAAPDPARGVP